MITELTWARAPSRVVLVEDAAEGAPNRSMRRQNPHHDAGDLDAGRQAAEKAYDEALQQRACNARQVTSVFATGAGRKQVAFATEGITKMTAGAKGGNFMFPRPARWWMSVPRKAVA